MERLGNSADEMRKRVLIVEDDVDLAELLGMLLEDAGYKVGFAEHGGAALSTLRHQRDWDVIILDLMMPVMNGWEFRAEQLLDPAIASIPVIAFSGDSHVADKAAGIGAAAGLRKPVGHDELLAALARVCGVPQR